MKYRPYPKRKDTPNRKQRKAARGKTFWTNYTANREAKGDR